MFSVSPQKFFFSLELKEIDETVRKARLFNFTTVSYNSADLTQQYLRYGVAGGLLLALAAYLPAPEEPLLPIGNKNIYALKIYDRCFYMNTTPMFKLTFPPYSYRFTKNQ